MKRLFAFFLALTIIAGLIPAAIVPVSATQVEELPVLPDTTEEIIQQEEETRKDPPRKVATGDNIVSSGTCGKNVTWTLDRSGTITISGTGPMSKYTFLDPAPWYDERASIVTAVIETGVTNVGDYAFFDCANLASAIIPDGDGIIGDSAFQNCTALTSITIGEGFTHIGRYAFQDCTGLVSVTLPESLIAIEHRGFYRCTSLSSITMGDNLVTIGSYAFYNCDSLKSITIPNSVSSIGSTGFAYCDALESITLPESLTIVRSDTFNGCTALESIRIPDNVTSIDLRAFYQCTSLTNVTLSAKLTEIGEAAFYLSQNLKSIVIPEGVTKIGDRAFNGGGLETVWFPLSLKTGGTDAFVGCPMNDVYYPGSSKQFRSIKFGPRSSNDFRDNATFHFGIPDLVAPSVSLVHNAQTGLQELTWEPIEDAVRYEIYRATNTNGPFTLVSDNSETSWRDPTAVIGKTYYYQVKAIHEDPDRSSPLSQLVTVKYVCGNPVVSIANDSAGKPKLSWGKVSDAKKYTVYRATSENGKYSKLGTTTKLSYTDSKASAGNAYYYKVMANGSKSSLNSGYSNIVSCGVICGIPTVTVKIDSNTGKPSLSWGKVSGAAKYAVYRDGELLATVTAVAYADSSAAIDTQYTYAVQALGKTVELNGAVSKAVTATSGIAKPAAKGSIDGVSGKPTLIWSAIEGAVKYEIYRSTSSNKNYKLLTTVETLNYTDESVSAGKTYYYQIKAIGQVSASANSSYVKVTGKCATPEISVVNDANGKPKLSWEKVSGAKKYTVYRATSENGKYSKLGTSTKLTYTDSKASAGNTYYYKVIANASSSKYNSGYSSIVSCGVICGTPSVTVKIDANTGKPSLSWGKVSGAVKYAIYRQLPGEEFVLLEEQTAVTYADKTAPIDTECKYYVQVLGKTSDLNGAASKVVTATSGIARPTVEAYAAWDTGCANLVWKYVDGAVKYEIYRSTKSNKGFTLIATVENRNYFSDTYAPGKTYYYKVVAVGAVSKSAETSAMKITGTCAPTKMKLSVDEKSGKPSLNWEKVEGAKKYEIYRAVNGGKFKKLTTTSKLGYIDTKASVGSYYAYKVRALVSSSSSAGEWSETEDRWCPAYCAQPKVTVKLNKSGDPVVSWNKITGAKQYIVMFVDVTDFIGSETGPSEDYLEENMEYLSTTKTSSTVTTVKSGRLYMFTVIAVPKNEDFFSVPSDPVSIQAK